MNAGYRLLQFVPNPFVQSALTFGALVDDDHGGRVALADAGESVLSASLPAPSTTLFRAIVAELRTLKGGRLPMSIGPHVRLTERVAIPQGVNDPLDWVSTFVLPSQALAQKRERRHQRTRRATVGKMFFKQHHVSQFVKSRFKAEMLGGSPRLVKPVTHFVRGSLETLLLEPVYLDSDRFEDEMQEAASTLLAWETIARKRTEKIEFSVYALGTSADHLKILREGVGDTGIRVVDTGRGVEREGLLEQIRATSLSRRLDS